MLRNLMKYVFQRVKVEVDLVSPLRNPLYTAFEGKSFYAPGIIARF